MCKNLKGEQNWKLISDGSEVRRFSEWKKLRKNSKDGDQKLLEEKKLSEVVKRVLVELKILRKNSKDGDQKLLGKSFKRSLSEWKKLRKNSKGRDQKMFEEKLAPGFKKSRNFEGPDPELI